MEKEDMVLNLIQIHQENVENYYENDYNGKEYETMDELITMYMTDLYNTLELDDVVLDDLHKVEKALRIIYDCDNNNGKEE